MSPFPADDDTKAKKRPALFQFSLRSMWILTTAFALLFAAARWAQLSAWTSLLVAVVFVASLIGATALVLALARSIEES